MLGFFRKHQKVFFIVTVSFAVVSFAFFGPGQTGGFDSQAQEDEQVGVLIDGSALGRIRLEGLLRLCEPGLGQGAKNELAGGFLDQKILLVGLGQMLAEHHFMAIEEEMGKKWKRCRAFIPYEHPFSSQICAKDVWKQFAPEIYALCEQIENGPEEFSKEQIPLLFSLYQAKEHFPEETLRRMLYYFEQVEKIQPDPSLAEMNLALFGFRSIEDWFGPTFFKLLGKTILDGACKAKELGYQSSTEEGALFLASNVYRALEEYKRAYKNAEIPEFDQVYQSQLRFCDLSENEAIAHAQDLLCFKQLFEQVGGGVLLDPLPFEQIKEAANNCQAMVYSLPDQLQFSSVKEMFWFEKYLQITTKHQVQPWAGDLFAPLADPLEVMNHFPMVVYKPFEVEIASATVDQAAASIPLRKTWEWQIQEDNYAQIQGSFPLLRIVDNQNENAKELRREAIDRLDPQTRLKIDHFCRCQMVLSDLSSYMGMQLDQAPLQTQTLHVRLAEENNPLSGAHFLALVESEDPSLAMYRGDDQTFYQIRVTKKGVGWFFVPFTTLKGETTLVHLIEKDLSDAGIDFEPIGFDAACGKLYRNLLTDLQVDSEEDLLGALEHRFDGYLLKMQTLARENKEAFEKVQMGPWALVATKENIRLGADSSLVASQNEFSLPEDGKFFQVLARYEPKASEEEIAQARNVLKQEAQKQLFSTLLKEGSNGS